MPRGAPQGNQNARKATRRRGLTVSYYISADVLEFLRDGLAGEAEKTDEGVRTHVHALFKKSIDEDIRHMFARYVARQEKT